MSALRQAVFGILAALLSSAILIGSLLLALVESGHKLAQAIPPTPLPPVNTPRVGEPTFTASPTSTSQATQMCPPPAGWMQIESLPGDTIASIALTYGISPEALRQANCDYVGNTIPSLTYLNVPGPTSTPTPTATDTATPTSEPTSTPRPARTAVQQPVCSGPPSSWVVYIVQRGDTLYSIATSRGTTVAELKSANCLDSDLIRVGQRLNVPFVPTRVPSPTPPPPATTEPPPATTEPPPATTEPPPATTEPPPATTEAPANPGAGATRSVIFLPREKR